MRLSNVLLTTIAALAVACSSATPAPDPTPGAGGAGTGGPAGGGAPAPSEGANPEGVAYPTADIGYRVGNRMPNYTFLGYVNGNKAGGLKAVSLADYYDPQAKRFKVIHIIGSSVWCAPCNQETTEAVAATDELLAEKIVFVQAMIDGPQLGVGATQGDLDAWVATHSIVGKFTVMLDPAVKNLGQFFQAGGVPWNANLDARTMEILSAKEGAPPSIKADVRRWTAWVDSHPPKQ